MDTRRTPIAAASSILVNLVLALSLALSLTQGADAATPAAYRSATEPATSTVVEDARAGSVVGRAHCASRLRIHVETRTLVAVILGMIV